MKITGSIKNDTLILYFNGELDHHSAQTTGEAIDNMLERYGFKKVIFDLAELSFIDSSGIGVFYGRRKLIKSDGGKCALADINKKIERFIHISGLDRMFELYDSEEDALEAWGKQL